MTAREKFVVFGLILGTFLVLALVGVVPALGFALGAWWMARRDFRKYRDG